MREKFFFSLLILTAGESALTRTGLASAQTTAASAQTSAASAQTNAASAQTSAASKTNPDISVNLLLLGSAEKPSGKKRKSQFSIQEAEFYFKSNIDPYWSGNLSLGAHYHEGHFEWDLEEAFIETLFIPQFTARSGKFYGLLGKHNDLHTHNYPFIDPPLINQTLFGKHGFGGYGFSGAWLAPLPWYTDATAQWFYTQDVKDISGILSLKSLWDIQDHSTLELALSYGKGIESLKKVYSASLTYKWKPLNESKKRSLIWTAEFLQGEADPEKQEKAKDQVKTAVRQEIQARSIQNIWGRLQSRRGGEHSGHGNSNHGDSNPGHSDGRSGHAHGEISPNEDFHIPSSWGGFSSDIQWQFLSSWRLQGRAEWLAPLKWNEISAQKYSLLLAFAPTEYSAIRLQYYTKKIKGGGWGHGLAIQRNVSMGAHPAHKY